MGYNQERKWWGGRIAAIFRNREFTRLTSCETRTLLGSKNDFCANQQDIEERNQYLFLNGDSEEVSKRICEFQTKIDELRRKMDEIKIEVANAENEKHDKTETENMEWATATLEGEIRKITDRIAVLEDKLDNKIKDTEKTAELETRNNALEREIKKLKERFVYLEVMSIQNMPGENASIAPLSGLDQIEEMEKPASYEELFAWIIVLAFFVGFLIGMQI